VGLRVHVDHYVSRATQHRYVLTDRYIGCTGNAPHDCPAWLLREDPEILSSHTNEETTNAGDSRTSAPLCTSWFHFSALTPFTISHSASDSSAINAGMPIAGKSRLESGGDSMSAKLLMR
jgi:hypothetical protein